MTTKYVFHPQADADLDLIWEFIADDNPEAADQVLEQIRTAIRKLILFPQRGIFVLIFMGVYAFKGLEIT